MSKGCQCDGKLFIQILITRHTSVMGANVTASAALGRVLTLVVSNVDSAISALVASPFLTLLLRRGNTTRRSLYSFSL